MSAGSSAIDINRRSRGAHSDLSDFVAIEEPLEIRIAHSTAQGRANRSISITMRTPGDDRELAAGFLFTESIIGRREDITSIETCGPPAPDSGNHNVIRVELAPDVRVDLGRLQRHFYTTSSCGVCGKSSLEALRVAGVAPVDDSRSIFDERTIVSIPDKMRAVQATFEQTGGLHAAACFDSAGNLVYAMEDVGRHNAVDKVVGKLLLEDRLPATELGLMVSGRASFELVQKTLVAGMPLLAAVSAPSSLAVDLAREFNMTLLGFVRGDTFNIYSGGERIAT